LRGLLLLESLPVLAVMAGAATAYHLGGQQARHELVMPVVVVTLGLVLVALFDRQKIVHDLREARRHSDEANAAKDEFLARMSHEIRTQMNGILGMLELMQTARLAPQEREYLDMACQSADWLLKLVNDILDFSKIEAGRLELDEAVLDVRRTFEGALQPLAMHAGEKGLQLSVQVDAGVPELLIGDAGRLRQVLVNLVGNAVKFTRQGEIEVTVQTVQESATGPEGLVEPLTAAPREPASFTADDAPLAQVCLQISVRDTGIGIAEDKQQLIFEAFRQADCSTSRCFGGSGLGLAIVAELAAMMGGRLWLQSRVGQGSTFHFTGRLRVADARSDSKRVECAPHAGPRTLGPLPPPCRARILLAEDGSINQRVAARLLERRGHSVVVVGNGRKAVEAVQQTPFDLILMDVEMPEMDGIQATRAIRAQTGGCRPPIIAISAHAIKGDRERFLAAGMDDYLAKPLSSHRLYAVVEKHLPSPRSEACDSQTGPASRP
jgi:signal transduction histidine kinase/CheY-like chemotaxis protein